MHKHLKRIATDAAGYFLILCGIAFGWLPGPGGIPLVIAGLGLLSINNKWARDLRRYALEHGGELIKILFPSHWFVQGLYDIVVVIMWLIVGILAWKHAAIWENSLAIALFFIALFIALMNRDRLQRLKNRRARRKP